MKCLYPLLLVTLVALLSSGATAEMMSVEAKLKERRLLEQIMRKEHYLQQPDANGESALGVLVTLTNYPNAVCLDGTPGAYYIFPGSKTNKWVFMFEGGGVCSTPMDCYGRAQTPLGSSSKYPAALPASFLTGSLSRDCTINPDFCDYSVIYVQYCDGALFSGSRTSTVSYNSTDLYFRGNNIKEDSLRSLYDLMLLYAVDTFVVSGCSAGAYATFLHSDDIIAKVKSHVPTIVKVGAIPLSGFFLLHENALGTPVIEDMLKAMFNMTRSIPNFPAACLAAMDADEQWRCGFSQYAFNYSTTPTFVVNSKTDAWQIPCELLATSTEGSKSEACLAVPGYQEGICPALSITPFQYCNDTQMAPILAYQTSFLNQVDTVQGFANSNNGAFISSCFTHCEGVENNYWKGLLIGTTTMNIAVGLWWAGLDAPKPKNSGVQGVRNSMVSNPNVYIDCTRKDSDPKYECNPTCQKPL